MSVATARPRRRLRFTASMLVLGATLGGCSPGGPAPTAGPANPTPLDTAATSSCLVDVASYPDATVDPAGSADVVGTVRSLGGSEQDWSAQWTPTTADVQTTTVAPDTVVGYVVGTMKALGWTSTGHRPGTNGGFERWSKGGIDAQVLVGSHNGLTVIVRACRTAPAPSGSATPAATTG